MSGWFSTLGWWNQKEAYTSFNTYRENPTHENFQIAVEQAIPIIRVVISTQKFKIFFGDEEDFISHAALIITKALPKMIKKPVKKLDDDKKYMRYLFTCVINAFSREYTILYGKQNKLQKKINNNRSKVAPKTVDHIGRLEADMILQKLPQQLYNHALFLVRFDGAEKNICAYILQQIMNNREISKSVLHLMGCVNRPFFISYCNNILYRAFLDLRDLANADDNDFFEEDEENTLSLLDEELLDYEELLGYNEPDEGSFGNDYAD